MATSLRYFLIGSTILHLYLFHLIPHYSPRATAAMPAVDAWLIDSPTARTTGPEPPFHPAGNNGPRAGIREKVPQLPSSQGERPASAAGKGDVEIARHPDAPGLPAPLPAQVTAPALTPAASPGTSNSAMPGHTSVKPPGGRLAIAAGQNLGAEQDMVLGDTGSPRFIHRETPAYPFMARKLGKEGKVVLRLALDAQGRLQEIDVVEANGFGFAEAACSAIRKSTFAPASQNSRAMPSRVLVTIRFVLHEAR